MWKSLHDTGIWRGEIWNRNKAGDIYPQLLTISAVRDAQSIVTGYVAAFSDITVMKQSENKLDFLAHHDALTELPNRLLFNERLNQAIRRAERREGLLAVAFIDLDRFKNVNDSLGHQYGDELLKQVGQRVTANIRAEDTLARISGDELIALLEGIGSVEDAAVAVEKIMASFVEPFSILGTEVRMSCTIGISLYPDDGDTSSELMRSADAAMYRAKNEGRDSYQFFEAEMTAEAFEHILVENAMRNALNNNEFFLVYQPQYRLNDLSITGIEVLLRWQHPDLGLIPPSRFIPIAEQSGQIRDIGDWVLRNACEQARNWLDQGFGFKRIAVNISGLQLQQTNFLATFNELLEDTRLPAGHLEFEVTETFFMKSTTHAISILTAVMQAGASISIDDFGTGYSSMSYLKKLPVNIIKIDQSFVRDTPEDKDDVEINKAIIAMAHALQLEVIAEGIETQDQLHLLEEIGCDFGQGYFFSKPITADEMTAFLREAAARERAGKE